MPAAERGKSGIEILEQWPESGMWDRMDWMWDMLILYGEAPGSTVEPALQVLCPLNQIKTKHLNHKIMHH
jgi:hypothetical protein